MDSRQVQSFKDWFNDYVENFYSEDPAIQEGIKFKEEHTKRVCGNIVRIGRSIDLQDADLNLAETIALFHDTGRFRQVAVYRTFNDRISENHSLLGLSELERAGVLSSLAREERDTVKKAIECHNLCVLPREMPGRSLLFTRLIRDADKLDILITSAVKYAKKNQGPNPLWSVPPDTGGYSPVLIKNLLEHKNCSYDDVKNSNDRKLLLLSWVYDINFPYTLAEIARNGCVEKIIASLPSTAEIREVRNCLREYLDLRLADFNKQ